MRRVASAAIALALTVPTLAHAQDADNDDEAEEAEEAQPADRVPTVDDDVMRYPPSSVRIPLIAGGLGLTLGTYGLSVLMGTSFDDVPGADALLIPVVGPWISLVQNDCAPDDPDCGAILVLRAILLVLDGLAQGGGLAIAGEGLLMTTEADAPPAADSGSLMVLPNVGPHHAGLGVIGTF